MWGPRQNQSTSIDIQYCFSARSSLHEAVYKQIIIVIHLNGFLYPNGSQTGKKNQNVSEHMQRAPLSLAPAYKHPFPSDGEKGIFLGQKE